jgi:hypothetical protein
MTQAYPCCLCGGSSWLRADLARRTEAAIREIARHHCTVHLDGEPCEAVPEALVRELVACVEEIDGRVPVQATMEGIAE